MSITSSVRVFAYCVTALIMFLVIFMGLYFSFHFLGISKESSMAISFFGSITFTIIGIFGTVYDSIKQDKILEREANDLTDLISKHFSALCRNLDRAVVKNDYGAIRIDKRELEIEDFLSSVSFNPVTMRKRGTLYPFFYEWIRILSEKERMNGFDSTSFPQGGLEFEFWVAESLQKFGWETKLTTGSGDQGVDIIASRDGVKLAIQCKRYQGKIGNKAVQEIVAGSKYHDARFALVITNSEYTSSAKSLAKVHGVHLLHVNDIPNIKSIFNL